jgi:hypothetical protein
MGSPVSFLVEFSKGGEPSLEEVRRVLDECSCLVSSFAPNLLPHTELLKWMCENEKLLARDLIAKVSDLNIFPSELNEDLAALLDDQLEAEDMPSDACITLAILLLMLFYLCCDSEAAPSGIIASPQLSVNLKADGWTLAVFEDKLMFVDEKAVTISTFSIEEAYTQLHSILLPHVNGLLELIAHATFSLLVSIWSCKRQQQKSRLSTSHYVPSRSIKNASQ